ncbi:MAG: ABC transporter ATP-binding protein [Suipraeoptans sp.]
MIEIKELHKYYNEGEAKVEVLKGLECEVDKGEICVLLGPSGSGKSTLLNLVGGIETIDKGDIVVGGLSLSNCSKNELSDYRRSNLGFVFQFYNLVPNLTVKENIEVGSFLSESPLPMQEMLDTLGLSGHKDKIPNQLSGGQQQRCSIGRAVIKNPNVLLCDEPTGALDFKTSKEILGLIEDLNKKYATTVILVTHNEAIADMAHRVIRLHDGKLKSMYMNDKRTSAAKLEW